MTAAVTSASPVSARSAGSHLRFYAIWLLGIAVLIILPLLFSSGGSLTSFSLIGIAIVFALSYNILLGQTGLLSFGHAVHYGLGGFAACHMMNAVVAHGWPIPLPFIPLFGGLGGLAFAILLGWVMTKRAGTVFAMISLGIGELVASSSLILRSVFGGEAGITTDRTALPRMFGWTFGPQIQVYYLIAFWLVLSAIAMYALTRTPLGRISNAVRDNPERVQFIGYDPHVVRYLAFCFAGFFAGVAGGLAAISFEIANSAYLGAIQSGLVLFSTFIGGTAYFFGPILGAILVTYLQLGLTSLTSVWQLYFGIIFIGIVMFSPGGIAGLLMMHRPLVRARTLGMVIPSYLLAVVPTAALACGVILTIETVARYSGGDAINLFGVAFNPQSPVTWAVAAVLVVGGFLVARLTWQRIAEAWDRAATVARDRGYLA
ncbi:Putative High-affinity branched-chain amino acid transport system permease protein livM (LIV-I protein M) [Bradyrhizobium sp. ORS 285]|uniref:branched-chain amino acid ABC transporter permease n=1 Tax=Bradyrhizobium sp. ORS 285 TaxID=115808 RepID=UPI000240563E|nr:branched-chain amino acid ABC transporter permease [Bradyrhizobium sp. ORS 285]CCD85378.1 putative High-affinity branched-chain amino acid transport system permease protein livM (LIV-I protein M) [Bradyrhizobium sp. ORS 285]SMX60033.1 Putative High-affinity branched-chain amino acid transport system permease protein livM (LIV-I protein M) [Bradyrhizobium sp. ORS 285]